MRSAVDVFELIFIYSVSLTVHRRCKYKSVQVLSSLEQKEGYYELLPKYSKVFFCLLLITFQNNMF